MQITFIKAENDYITDRDIPYVIYDANLGLLVIEPLECVSWTELQNIKNQVLGEDVTCIEYYPQENIVFDEDSPRFLWVLSVYDEYPNLSLEKYKKAPEKYREYVTYAINTPLRDRIAKANKKVKDQREVLKQEKENDYD